MNFDYRRAWTNLAFPSWQKLDPEVHALVRLTDETAEGIRQGPDLRLPWPGREQLWQRLEALDSCTLAYGARVVWSVGHWLPTDDIVAKGLRWLQVRGAYWRFSLYADHVLAARLLPTSRRWAKSDWRGWDVQVHDGLVRLCASTNDSWTCTEIGWATEDVIGRIAERLQGIQFSEENHERLARELRAELGEGNPWFTAGTDYVEGRP